MIATLLENPAVADRAHALRLAKHVIKTLDQKPLEPIVAEMLTDGHKAALSAMAMSRDEPDLFERLSQWSKPRLRVGAGRVSHRPRGTVRET